MRRRYLLLLLVPAVVLLALGALPSILGGGGDVSYAVATEVDLEDGEPAAENATETIAFENLSERRFPYTTQAIDEGRSDPYEEGRFGLKSSFTHTPFDEFSEFETWNRAAVDGDTVWIERNGSYYRVEITQEPDE